MKAKCIKCGDTVEVTRPREYKSCKCGAINLDYGDGEYYFRVGGNPEDFDGEIEGAPKIHTGDIVIEHFHPEQTETTIRYNKPADGSMEKATELAEQPAYLLLDKWGEVVAKLELEDGDDHSIVGNIKVAESWYDDGQVCYDFFASVMIKWDGCSHWNFVDSYYHICGFDDMKKIRAIMAFAWKVARDFMSEKCALKNRTLLEADSEFPEDELNEMLKGYSIKKGE